MEECCLFLKDVDDGVLDTIGLGEIDVECDAEVEGNGENVTEGEGVELEVGVVLGDGDAEGLGVTVRNRRVTPCSSSGSLTGFPDIWLFCFRASFTLSEIFSAFLF